MKYPIGIQSFEKIRTEDKLYIDKTALVYQLVNSGTYYFLSRPRRFGKSLLISTLEAYFLGKKELFKGLAMEQLETEWNTYPVLHLDLTRGKYETLESLDEVLNIHLSKWEALYGTNPVEKEPGSRFAGVIERAHEKTGKQVVILVDEYDKPLLKTIGNPQLQDSYRSTLKAFYSVLKSCDPHIKFAILTGVTKFSKVSIFSDLNNLKDISMQPRYHDICGITEQELRDNLDEEVYKLAVANSLDKRACYDRLRLMYDGYHFRENTNGLYNPFSLLNTLDNNLFDFYWFETGTPSLLVEVMKRCNYPLDRMNDSQATADLLGSIDSIERTPLPLFFQAGYLTIKGYNQRFKKYTLGFPNQEVEEAFTRFLIPYYTPNKSEKTEFDVENFLEELESGKPGAFMKRLNALFADTTYQIQGEKELYFQNATYVFFKVMGFYTQVERATSDGRIDMIVKTPDFIYLFEFKIDKSADEALAQINSKEYALPFSADSRQLYKIGVNFASETGRIDGWKIENTEFV